MQIGKTHILMALTGLFIFFESQARVHDGVIQGTIIDSQTQQPVEGATVSLVGTSRGTVSDKDGEFRFPELSIGKYTLQVSYIGYVEMRITDIGVESDQPTSLEIRIEESGEMMDEVVITSARNRGGDLALLVERHQSSTIVQKIGAQELSRKGISDAAGAVTAMSGISKQEGSNQIYVRGLGDRYNSTALNGLPLPSNDPEKKNIALDLFSTDIVEYISVDKVYSNRISGDFGGGNVDIYSRNYSGPGLLEVSIGSTLSGNALSNSDNFYLYPGANQFGFSRYEIPQNPLGGFNFKNSINPQSRKPIPGNVGIVAGKSIHLGSEKRLNLFGTVKFSNGFEHRLGINRNVSAQGARLQDLDQERFTYNTNSTGLLNVNFVINQNHRIGHNFMFVNSSDQANDIYRGFIRDIAENDNGLVQRGTYKQNKLFVEQFVGNHRLTDRLDVDWGLSATHIASEMPDRVQNTFRFVDQQDGYLFAQNTITDNHRYNQRLTENEYALNASAAYKIGAIDEPHATLRFGYSGRLKKRDFEAIQFNFRMNGTQLNAVVDPSNLDAFFNQQNYNAGYFSIESFAGETPQTYQGNQDIHAGHVGLEYQLTERLTSIIGIRYERLIQAVTWRTQLDPVGRENTFSRNELLPNLSLRYALNDKQNLRLAASKTYTLPQFKERALFVYEDVTETKVGNPDLYPSQNYNLDLKWELFPSAAELVSVTAFGKYILDPINETTVASSTNDISFINTGDVGTVVGVEFELRKDIFNVNEASIMTAGFNAAYMQTSQDLSSEKVGAETRYNINLTDTRASFTGASDLLMNADLTFTKRWNNQSNIMATLAYSYFSDKIYSLGVETKGNLVDRGVGTLDFILRSKINRKVGVDLIVRNLLDPTYERVQENAGGHVPVLTYKKGVFYSIGLKYQL